MTAVSNESLVENYEADGFAIAERLLPESWCDNLIAASGALPSMAKQLWHPEMNVHARGGIFLDTMAHPEILAIIDRLVGGEANGLQSPAILPSTRNAGVPCTSGQLLCRGR